jgi:uncharacterized membrane protein YoaK (UPF0700 family)
MAGILDAVFHVVQVVTGVLDGNLVTLAVGTAHADKEDVVA